jgi:hypothetical protein
MRLPTMARSRAKTLIPLVAASLLLAACADEATAPSASTPSTQERTSRFTPTAAQLDLVGISDGVYTFTFDPSRDQSFDLGPNHLDIPRNAVCDLQTTSYGTEYWNDHCSPERGMVTITATISHAKSAHPRIDFQPAMRFNPKTEVVLYIYAKRASKKDAENFVMEYCSTDHGKCVDESKTDRDLVTQVDKRKNVVFRRIKHFSGYVVAERYGPAVDSFGLVGY